MIKKTYRQLDHLTYSFEEVIFNVTHPISKRECLLPSCLVNPRVLQTEHCVIKLILNSMFSRFLNVLSLSYCYIS